MPINKVVYGGVTIVDISDSTVTPETLGNGVTAYDKTGAKITGNMTIQNTETWVFTMEDGSEIEKDVVVNSVIGG